MKRGQSALEFVMLASMMFMLFGVTIVGIQKSLADATEATKQQTVLEIQQAITSELALAQRMPMGYERIFELPPDIQGLGYSLRVHTENPPARDELLVSLLDETAVVFLQQNVLGTLAPGTNTIYRHSAGIGLNAYPIAQWLLNEGTGTFIEDTAFGSYNGTLGGGAVWVTTGYVYPQAVDFSSNANSDIVAAFPAEFTPGASWSIALWLNTDSISGNQRQWAIAIGDGDPHRTIGFFMHGNSDLAWAGYGDANNRISTDFAPYFNSWQHVTITYESSSQELTLYINKIQHAQQTLPGPVSFAGGQVHLGHEHPALAMGSGGDQPLDGALGPVTLYNKALTPAQVNQLY